MDQLKLISRNSHFFQLFLAYIHAIGGGGEGGGGRGGGGGAGGRTVVGLGGRAGHWLHAGRHG